MNERRKIMNPMYANLFRLKLLATLTVFAVACSVVLIAPASRAQTPTAMHGVKTFETPQQAADALVAATESYDTTALTELLGPNSSDIISSGEPARDKEMASAFAAQARQKMNIELDTTQHRATMVVGNEDWPLPIPIVKVGKTWHFDAAAGRKELLFRRIGRNELDAIQICRGYVEAQHAYALAKKVNGVNQYAQRIISTPGQQDGLAWQNPDGTWDGPVGEKIAQAIAQGYSNRAEPFHGYFFKVLKGQGPAAPMGEMNFVIKGVMIGGFALIAAPAQYRNTGVKTFMVSHDGVVYQKDLGPKTLEIFQSTELFNPDKTWTPVLEDQ